MLKEHSSRASRLMRKLVTAFTTMALAGTIFAAAPAPVRAAGDTVQTITFSVIENVRLATGLVELMVSSDSGLTVTVEAVDSAGICSVTGYEVTLLATGDCHLQATQPGNDTYAAADPVDRSFVILDDTGDVITSFSLNGDTDMQYGLAYSSVPGQNFKNYFLIDWTVSGDATPTIDSLTPDICEVSNGAPFDGTVGYFIGAGECFMAASLYDGDEDDVYASIRIDRGDPTLIPEPYVDATGDYSTGIVASGVSVLDMFDRPNMPRYVSSHDNLPIYQIDPSAGYEYGMLRECVSGHHGDKRGFDPTIGILRAGTCYVRVNAMKQPNWMKTEPHNVNVNIRKMDRWIYIDEFGVGNGTQEVAKSTHVGYIGRPFFIEASASQGHWLERMEDDGIQWSIVTGNCQVADSDHTIGVITEADGTGDQCKVRMSLPETQNYNATISRDLLIKFMREPGKINFTKIPTFTLSPDNSRRFTVDAVVTSLSGGPTHKRVDHRPRLSFSGPVCEELDFPADPESGNRRNTSTDRTMGFAVQAGLCTVTARVSGDYGVSAQPVRRSFNIVKSSNTITFPTIVNHGAGDTLVQDSDFTVDSTWHETTLSTASAACSVSHNDETDLWEIELGAIGTCKITASNPGTRRVKTATPVTRIFTVTKAAGQIVLGADLGSNGLFGNMYLEDDECYGVSSGGCYDGDQRTVRFSPVSNRVYSLSSVDNSDGAVTYSKVSGACTVSNPAATVTITGRNADGTCVVKVTLGATVEKTSAFDTFTISVNKADATIGFWTTPGPLSIGTNVTLNALSEAGTVQYSTADAGVCSVSGSTLTPVSEGTCTVYANVPANDAYDAAPQRQYEVPVTKATQTITFTTVAERTYPSGTNIITVNPTTSAVGLTVSITLGEGSSGCTSGGAGGKTITFTGVGSCILVASQAGNGSYLAADDVTRTIVISKKPVAVAAPTVSMPVARQGQSASRTQGDWTGSGGTLAYSTQWYRCTSSSVATPTTANVSGCTATGGTGATYTAINTDVNRYLRVRITVTNFSGTSYRWSTTTAKVLTPAP